MKMKRQISLLVISAFLIGLLPVRDSTAIKAEFVSASAATPAPTEKNTNSDYELKNPRTNADDMTTWDCVWFGSYWQEDTNGDGKADKNDAKQPIKWRVLSLDDDDAFLLADKSLDCQRYHDTEKDVTWETCTMRSWLNGYGAEANQEGKDYSEDNFLNDAFTPAEQSAIGTTNVANNNDNAHYPTEGGNDTSDKVYLLSLTEVVNPVYGFSPNDLKEDENRWAKNTEYAIEKGAWTSPYTEFAGNGCWWLRSPGDGSSFASYGDGLGDVNDYGIDVNRYDMAVRPALHIKLKASSDTISASGWSYAGTVISEKFRPAKVVSVKLKQKKHTVTVSWKKVKGYYSAAGYQICYSTSRKWKKRKQKLFRKNKVTMKNLKKKKTYYFRVRAYLVHEGEEVYGAWSKTKKIKIKK